MKADFSALNKEVKSKKRGKARMNSVVLDWGWKKYQYGLRI